MAAFEESEVTAAVAEILPELDDDTRAYVVSMMAEPGSDIDEMKEMVAGLIVSFGVVEEEEGAAALVAQLLDKLQIDGSAGAAEEPSEPQLLTKKVNMAAQDEATMFAGKLNYDGSTVQIRPQAAEEEGEDGDKKLVAIFNDRMETKTAESSKARRKKNQSRARDLQRADDERRMEEEIAHRMALGLQTVDLSADGEGGMGGMTDVRLQNFDLPNKKGAGDLLRGANLTLPVRRRLAIVGRNGCGKTTLMEAIARRAIAGVPASASMLLVKQEIVGSHMTSIQTVLSSDPERQALTRLAQQLEEVLAKAAAAAETASGSGGAVGAGGGAGTEDGTAAGASAEGGGEGDAKAKRRAKAKAGGGKGAKGAKGAKGGKGKKGKGDAGAAAAPVVEDWKSDPEVAAAKLELVHSKLALKDETAGAAEPRARRILHGMGFTPEMQEKSTEELSGGWRMRVSLACALFASPRLLLLDEPTNHLDLEAVLWLENYLTTSFDGTLLCVSHDRHFLNVIATDVIHFHHETLDSYRGDVASFEAVRQEHMLRQKRLFEQQEAKRKHLQDYIDKHAQSGENGPKAAAQRKSRMKKMERLGIEGAKGGGKFKASLDEPIEDVEECMEDPEVKLIFPDPGETTTKQLVQIEGLSFAYPGQPPIFEDVDFNVDQRSRVALLGRNGAGKSTLIKLIMDRINPTAGRVSYTAARIEYIAQHQVEQLDLDSTPIGHMLSHYPGNSGAQHELNLRQYLARFGLGGEVLPVQTISTLSGGQKCRLCLAASMYRKPHLLILDEPTNHLDMETIDALIVALKDFKGGVLVVSHDQHLLTSVCKDLYVVGDGQVARFNGDFKDYKKKVLRHVPGGV